ncbi:MAG: hypothetical protein ABSF48_26015, partial [Thermodesulfobacteriota bacterium]
GRGHCLLSTAKLTAIIHYVYWGRYLPQKKNCRVSISSPFPRFFNTLSDRLGPNSSAFFIPAFYQKSLPLLQVSKRKFVGGRVKFGGRAKIPY